MSFNIEKNLNKIKSIKNWNNIILRNLIREDIQSGNEFIDQIQLNKYLDSLTNDDLIEMRHRVFKIARDHYVDSLIRQFSSKPVLKEMNLNYSNKYILKTNMMKDVYEFLQFVLNLQPELPSRCIDFDSEVFKFPLGNKQLNEQLNAIQKLRIKIMDHEKEMDNFKKYATDIDKLENNLVLTYCKLQKMLKQNQYLKACLTILLTLFIIFLILFLFTTCMK
jgi:hypothetical protein